MNVAYNNGLPKRSKLWLFCRKNELFVRKSDGKEIERTHMCLNGGMLGIPKQHNDEFLRLYCDDVAKGYIFYIAEQKTPVYRFFVDFDMEISRIPDDEYILKIIHILRERIAKFFPDDPNINKINECYILKADEKEIVQENGNSLYKCGYHFVFPNLFVDNQMSMCIRCAVLSELEYKEIKGPDESICDWPKIYDESIYKSNGLRMIASHKCFKCRKCNDIIDGCEECDYNGYIDQARPYYVHNILSPIVDQSNIILYKDLSRSINKCSIRVFDVEINPHFKKPDNFPEPKPKLDVISRTKGYKRVKRGTIQSFQDDYEAVKRFKDGDKIHVTDKSGTSGNIVFNNVQKFIRSLRTEYQKICLGEFFTTAKYKSTGIYIITVKGEGSQFCLNLKTKYHRSNSIYFILNPKGIKQKCFCRCPTTEGRLNGMCKLFNGPVIRLPPSIYSDLYGMNDTQYNSLIHFTPSEINLPNNQQIAKHLSDKLFGNH